MSNDLSIIKSKSQAIDNLKNEVQNVVHVQDNREQQLLLNNMLYMNEEVKKNKELEKAIINDCNKFAIYLKNLTTLGVDLSQKQAYFLPFNGEIASVLDYKTLMVLIKKHTNVVNIESALVYENEDFKVEQNKVITHKQNPFASVDERGALVGAYSVFTLDNGIKEYYFASVDEINKVRECSKSSNSKYSPWNTWFEEMVRKTVIRKGMKFYPLIIDFEKQQALDNLDNDVDFSQPQEPQPRQKVEVKVNDCPERTELINYCQEHGLNMAQVSKEFLLSRDSECSDFKFALEQLKKREVEKIEAEVIE